MNFSKSLITFPLFCLIVLFSCTTHSLPVKERMLAVSPLPTIAPPDFSYSSDEFRKPENTRFQIGAPLPFEIFGVSSPLSLIFLSEIFTQYESYPGSGVYSNVMRLDRGLSDMLDNKYFFSTIETDPISYQTFARFWMASSIGASAHLVADFRDIPRDFIVATDAMKKVLYFTAASFPDGSLSLWRTWGGLSATEEVFTFNQDADLTYPKNFTLLKKYPNVILDTSSYSIAFLMKDSTGEVQINIFDSQTKLVTAVDLLSIQKEEPKFLQTMTHEGKEKLLFVARDPLTMREGIYMLDPDFPNLLDEIVPPRPYTILDLKVQSEINSHLLQEKIFYSVRDLEGKTHLYISDGNLASGPSVLKILLGGTNDDYAPQILTSMRVDDKATLFFTGMLNGLERRNFATDGVSTWRLDKYNEGINGQNPEDFIILNMDGVDTAFFLADTLTSYVKEIEREVLTETGSTIIKELVYQDKIEKGIWYSYGKQEDASPLWIIPETLGEKVQSLSLQKIYEDNHLRNKLSYQAKNDYYGLSSFMIDLAPTEEILLMPKAPRFVFKMPPTSFSGDAIIEAVNLDFGDTIRLYRDEYCSPFTEFAIGVSQGGFLDFYFDDEALLSFQTSAPFTNPRKFSYYAKRILRGSAKESLCSYIELEY